MRAGKTGVEASKTMWRCCDIFIGSKPKGGRGQLLRTCWSSLEHEQSQRRLDRRQRRMGWLSESLCCSPLLPRPSALLASPAEADGQQRRLSRRQQQAMSAASSDAGGGRAIATGRCSWSRFRHSNGQ